MFQSKNSVGEGEVRMRNVFLVACMAAAMTATAMFAADTTPKTVIHVIAIQWK